MRMTQARRRVAMTSDTPGGYSDDLVALPGGISMSAYIISDLSARDPDSLQIYRARAAASIAQYGGRYLSRGGAIETLEGDWRPEMIVVVEFPSMEQARAWYRSPEYATALAVRDKALGRDLILVDGTVIAS
jgi:uncharacterized protein (DUF1330 family)